METLSAVDDGQLQMRTKSWGYPPTLSIHSLLCECCMSGFMYVGPWLIDAYHTDQNTHHLAIHFLTAEKIENYTQ